MEKSTELNSASRMDQEVNQTNGKKLWNPIGFIVLSILFSFLPAAILYSLNYGRLGFTKKKNISLIISFVVFIAMISMAFFISGGILRSIIYVINIAAAVYMHKDQSKLFENHIQNGGRKASYLIPTILSTIVAVISMFGFFYSINIPDKKLLFNDNELYYTGNVQKDEAEKLGEYLKEQGLFGETGKISVKIDKESSTYKFSLIIDNSKLEDKNLELSAKAMSEELSKYVFNNDKVDIIFCNNVFKPLKVISTP